MNIKIQFDAPHYLPVYIGFNINLLTQGHAAIVWNICQMA